MQIKATTEKAFNIKSKNRSDYLSINVPEPCIVHIVRREKDIEVESALQHTEIESKDNSAGFINDINSIQNTSIDKVISSKKSLSSQLLREQDQLNALSKKLKEHLQNEMKVKRKAMNRVEVSDTPAPVDSNISSTGSSSGTGSSKWSSVKASTEATEPSGSSKYSSAGNSSKSSASGSVKASIEYTAPVSAPAAAESPWIEKTNLSGDIYWYHSETHETSATAPAGWEAPVPAVTPAAYVAPSPDAAESPWIEKTNLAGDIYWYHTETHETSATAPAGWR